MPLLGRLFTRKNKNRGTLNDDTQASSTLGSPTAVSESNHSSHTASSYVTPDISTPSDLNAKNSVKDELGGSRLRLFSRKKSSIPASERPANPASLSDFSTPQRPAFPRLSDADTDPSDVRRLRPPPSRSAIFAAYADPGSALSTRSLPENSIQKTNSSPPPPLPQKRPSFFAWAKPSSSSSIKSAKKNDIPFNTQSDSSDSRTDSSFNLRSFTHIRPPSPPFDVSSPDVSLVPPIPRPRGSSMHSDTSQRISVAAFREAQARRSHNGSPVPSPRESSLIPPFPVQGTHETRAVGNGPRASRSSAALLQHDHTKRSSTAIASTTDDDDSSSDSSEDDSVHRRRNNRLGAGKLKSKSETGHGSTTPFKKLNDEPPLPKPSRSHVGHSSNPRPLSHFELKDEPIKPGMHPRSQSSLGAYVSHGRRGANNSMGTLISGTATHHQSASVPSNLRNLMPRKVSPLQPAGNQQRTKSAIQPPPRDSSDSDDNAPLATLVAPRRPGSAMSSYSNPRSASGHSQTTARSPSYSKPLINVNEVITSKPTSVTSPPSDAGFTQGPTLLSCGKSATTTTYGTLQVVESPKSGETKPLAKMVTPVKTMSLPSSPAKDMKELLAQSLEGTRNSDSSDSPSQKTPQNTETSSKRAPLSDRLSRAVKKSLTSSPASSVTPSSPPAPKNTSLSRERSPIPGVASSESLQMRRSTETPRVVLPRNLAPVVQPSPDEYSPPDEDLAKLLGTAAIRFISRTGESPEESSESESSEEEKQKEKDRIAPIPIKRRSPPPAFTVTSRPPLSKQQEQSDVTPSVSQSPPNQTETRATQPPTTHSNERQRSSTLMPFPSFPSSNTPGSGTDLTASRRNPTPTGPDNSSKSGSPNDRERTTSVQPAFVKQRSNTMVSGVPSRLQRPFNVLDRSLATIRGNSPSSSTGDSSSGHAPHTPQDGSELGVREEGVRKKPAKPKDSIEPSSGLGIKRQTAHVKRRSVSFEDSLPELSTKPSKSHIREGARVGSDALGARGGSHLREGAGISLDNGDLSDEGGKEAKRKERRRKEAKNAIELGNVIHGPPPVLDDDNNDMPTNQAMDPRLSSFSPLMGMGSPMTLPMGFGPSPSRGWVSGMLTPAQFMVPRPTDPNLFVAHQQAMMYAKQAYQMAVAQQAMAAAGEEWERGSAIGSFGGTGNVYGGSTAPPIMNSSLGMMQGMGMMGPSASAGWSSSASVYGGMGAIPRFGSHLTPGDVMLSSSRSDYGGATSGSQNSANWSYSRSVYGESIGTANASRERRGSGSQQQQPIRSQRNSGRDSSTFPHVPLLPASQGANGRGIPEFRGPRLRTSSQPASPTRTNALPRRAPPPSSWRLAGA